MDLFCDEFERAIPDIKEQILADFRRIGVQSGYRSAWEDFEQVINPIIIEFLQKPPLGITEKCPPRSKSKKLNCYKEAQGKSSYPDLKIIFNGKLYAIDVKSGEAGKKEPWYDMGRIDSYIQKRINQFEAEYCITVKWRYLGAKAFKRMQDVEAGALEVVDVFIEPSYKSVGISSRTQGILYRPYDGKIRPKSWADFEAMSSYWTDKEHFLRGLAVSQIHRWQTYIVAWYKIMSVDQQAKVREYLDRVDAGEDVVLDQVPLDPAAGIEDEATSEDNQNNDNPSDAVQPSLF